MCGFGGIILLGWRNPKIQLVHKINQKIAPIQSENSPRFNLDILIASGVRFYRFIPNGFPDLGNKFYGFIWCIYWNYEIRLYRFDLHRNPDFIWGPRPIQYFLSCHVVSYPILPTGLDRAGKTGPGAK